MWPGRAPSPRLDPDDSDYAWTDRGPVLVSQTSDDFNAIDPGVVEDGDGTPWMAFGSFWSGIRMAELQWPSGLLAGDSEPLSIAGGRDGPNAIEAPSVLEHEGAFYLFVSIGACCKGARSTYEVAVGRSDSVTGPYVDRDGIPMVDGGATVLATSEGDRVGPGGESISKGLMGYHFYDAGNGGLPRLAISTIRWGSDGWPAID